MKQTDKIKLPAKVWVIVVGVIGFLFTLMLITLILLER